MRRILVYSILGLLGGVASVSAQHVRVMQYNIDGHLGNPNPLSNKTAAAQALARIINYNQPDIVTFNELQDNGTINTAAGLIDWVTNNLTYFGSKTGVTFWVDIATVSDGFQRNGSISRYPTSDATTYSDGRTGCSSCTFTNLRGMESFKVQLSGTNALQIFHAHLKASSTGTSCPRKQEEAETDATNMVNWASTNTFPYIFTGDCNESEDPRDTPECTITSTYHPITTLREGGRLVEFEPTNLSGNWITWSTGNPAPFTNIRFDYVLASTNRISPTFSATTACIVTGYVFSTMDWAAHGLYTNASPQNLVNDSQTASDHYCVLVDYFFPTNVIIACQYTLSAPNASFDLDGGTNTVSVTTSTNSCSWTAVSHVAWIEILDGGSGINTGDATVVYSVLPNIGNARTGTVTIAGQTFIVTQDGDTVPPTVILTAPSAGVVSNTIVLAANATDDVAVARVEFYRDGGALAGTSTAPPYNASFSTATVGDGPHCFYALAYDAANNVSSSSTNCVIVDNNPPSVPAPTATAVSSNQIDLTWSASSDPGSGVAGYNVFRQGTPIATTTGTNYSDTGLAGGTLYCYNVDAVDNVGRVSTRSPDVCAQTFTKVEALAGTYNGLLIQTNAPTFASSGSIRFVLGPAGTFAAKLILGGARSSFAGQFDALGHATTQIARRGLAALRVVLQLDPASGDQITGTISDGTFTSVLLADREVYSRANPCPFAGTFSIVIEPPPGDNPTVPQGCGYGRLTVTKAGRGRVGGVLGDGARIRVTAPVSKHGTWPLYDLLYKNQGASVSWVTFATNQTLDATVDWFRPPIPSAAFYPRGFTTNVAMVGNEYLPPTVYGAPSASPDRRITLGGGNLAAIIVKSVYVYDMGDVVVLSPNGENLKIRLDPATGQLSGSFTHPVLNKTINFKGVALEFDGRWAGYFPGADLTGYVLVEPTP
jgi:endonuclease/exonuclease/phosphatase family metal-dependent hydrolase